MQKWASVAKILLLKNRLLRVGLVSPKMYINKDPSSEQSIWPHNLEVNKMDF